MFFSVGNIYILLLNLQYVIIEDEFIRSCGTIRMFITLSEYTETGFSFFTSSKTLAFLGFKTLTNKIVAKTQVIPSTQNNPWYPIVVIMIPPTAGPAVKPKLIAKRINVTDLVLFSGLLYELSATNIAGRNVSATIIKKKIETQKPNTKELRLAY